MKKVLIYGGFFFVLAFLDAGCMNKEEQPIPEFNSPPALLYIEKCGTCHPVHHPLTHTYTGWTTVITRMEKNAETYGIGPILSGEERSIILGYLKKHGRRRI